MTSSATLAALLVAALVGRPLVFGTVSATAAGPNNQVASICKPQPNGKTIGERSTCPFTVTEDNDFKRAPAIIYHFSCNCPTSRCSDREDYRCVQVRKPLEVQFSRYSSVRQVLVKKVVQVNASCVCATPVALGGASRRQDRILDETGKKKTPKDVEGVIKIHINDTVDDVEKLYLNWCEPIQSITLSTTLVGLTCIVLVGRQVDCTSNTVDSYEQSDSICKPWPYDESLGKRSACPFTLKEDWDYRRSPRILYHFNCNCPASRCRDLGDYRCFQVRIALRVLIQDFSREKRVVYWEDVTLNASCVCAATTSQPIRPAV
ncbi:hypothetical protein MTO96_012238 [Rhipicephalus appendiculatus]